MLHKVVSYSLFKFLVSNYSTILLYYIIHIHMYIPLITVTVPRVLVVFEVDRTIHWIVVVPLIENTVNEYVRGLVGLFR